jgi:hypothetical protein
MNITESRPLLFLDLRDVLCVGPSKNGLDLLLAESPAAAMQELLAVAPCELLRALHEACQPRYVLTSVWQLFLDREDFEALFDAAGLRCVSDALHEAWALTPMRHLTRQQSIANWLQRHHRGEPFAVLNGHLNGSGLSESEWAAREQVVMCRENEGLGSAHVEQLKRALSRPDAR